MAVLDHRFDIWPHCLASVVKHLLRAQARYVLLGPGNLLMYVLGSAGGDRHAAGSPVQALTAFVTRLALRRQT
jgi:hypothetical protein